MSLELSSIEASALDLGFRWGLISRNNIITIADALIASSKVTPSSEICSLAVCTRDYQISETLAQFSNDGADKWQPVILLLKKYLKVSDLDTPSLHKLYYSISNYADWEDREPWRKIKILSHELSDAVIGVYGDPKEIGDEIYELLISAE